MYSCNGSKDHFPWIVIDNIISKPCEPRLQIEAGVGSEFGILGRGGNYVGSYLFFGIFYVVHHSNYWKQGPMASSRALTDQGMVSWHYLFTRLGVKHLRLHPAKVWHASKKRERYDTLWRPANTLQCFCSNQLNVSLRNASMQSNARDGKVSIVLWSRQTPKRSKNANLQLIVDIWFLVAIVWHTSCTSAV
jgi:hypothetical protein